MRIWIWKNAYFHFYISLWPLFDFSSSSLFPECSLGPSRPSLPGLCSNTDFSFNQMWLQWASSCDNLFLAIDPASWPGPCFPLLFGSAVVIKMLPGSPSLLSKVSFPPQQQFSISLRSHISLASFVSAIVFYSVLHPSCLHPFLLSSLVCFQHLFSYIVTILHPRDLQNSISHNTVQCVLGHICLWICEPPHLIRIQLLHKVKHLDDSASFINAPGEFWAFPAKTGGSFGQLVGHYTKDYQSGVCSFCPFWRPMVAELQIEILHFTLSI